MKARDIVLKKYAHLYESIRNGYVLDAHITSVHQNDDHVVLTIIKKLPECDMTKHYCEILTTEVKKCKRRTNEEARDFVLKWYDIQNTNIQDGVCVDAIIDLKYYIPGVTIAIGIAMIFEDGDIATPTHTRGLGN